MKTNYVLSKRAQRVLDMKKEERRINAAENRRKRKSLSVEDKAAIDVLEIKLKKLMNYHPLDCLSFGVSVKEERRNVRYRIKSILDKY